MTSNNVTLSTSLATVNCSALLECAACATERVCAWLADTEAATGSCIVRTPAMHVVAPWHLVRNATACPVYATSAQLLFDPAMLVMLISICGALWLGARRSVSASHGGANGSNGNADENGNSNSAPNVTQHMHSHLRDMRLTPKRIAMFLLIPLCGSARAAAVLFFHHNRLLLSARRHYDCWSLLALPAACAHLSLARASLCARARRRAVSLCATARFGAIRCRRGIVGALRRALARQQLLAFHQSRRSRRRRRRARARPRFPLYATRFCLACFCSSTTASGYSPRFCVRRPTTRCQRR
jgi:hypothetical protein